MPRVNKLRMINNLPKAYARVCEISQLLGYDKPPNFSPKKSQLISDRLILVGEDGEQICTYSLEQPDVNTVVLANGKAITDHEFHKLKGENIEDTGFYLDCQCSNCIRRRDNHTKKVAEELSVGLDEHYVAIKVPKEQKITSVSPDLNERLPSEYKFPPVIVGYYHTSTADNLP